MRKLFVCFITIAFLPGLTLPLHTSVRVQVQKPKSRALLVGISNYEGPNVPPTRGAEEDAVETAEFIKSQYGFLDNEVKVLKGQQATARNIIAEFQHWLIDGTQPGDRVFFLYAGHGSQLPDDNGDEDDHLDETLAPYDVKLDGSNMIRDDEIGRLVAQLSGRLAVLLFDSCHSGTITRAPGGGSAGKSDARYLPSPKQVTDAKAKGTRGAAGDYEVRDLPQDSRILKIRDLKLVKTKTVGPASGIVVISAAQAGQVAFSMDVGGGRQRGALSYVFSQVQRNHNLTLKELGEEIKTCFTELHRDHALKGTQQPEVEVISTVPLNDKPLFADELTIPAVALVNPHSTVKLSLRTRESKTVYRFGETVSYQIETDKAGYLYLLVFSQEDKVTCAFPNEYDRDNYLQPGSHTLPRPNTPLIEVGEPAGKDTVIALLSATKLNLGEKDKYSWGEVFERLKSKQFAEYLKATRGQTLQKPAGLTDWQAVSLVLEAVNKPR